MARFPPEEWQVEQLRFTLFPVANDTRRSTGWWNFVTEADPDQVASNTKRGTALVKGAFGPGVLQLRLELDRVDWVLGPPEPETPDSTIEFTMPGVAFELIDQFTEVISRWFGANDFLEVTRVAFGCMLAHRVADRDAGYVQVTDYVPIDIEPGSTDFQYQINLPVIVSAVGVPNLKLNRLSKWSVPAHGFIMVSLSQMESVTRREFQDFFVRLEVDVNTVGTFEGAIPRDRLVAVCRELVQHAKIIATEGIRRNA